MISASVISGKRARLKCGTCRSLHGFLDPDRRMPERLVVTIFKGHSDDWLAHGQNDVCNSGRHVIPEA